MAIDKYYKGTVTIRRLLKYDMYDVISLYKSVAGDGAWMSEETYLKLIAQGEAWGVIDKGKIVACCAMCGASLQTTTVKMLCRYELLCGKSMLILPPCGDSKYWLELLVFLLKRADDFRSQGDKTRHVLCLPVKTGTQFVGTYFDAGLTMVAVRPLDRLRINYIFFSDFNVQTDEKNSIMVSKADTLSLSRCLEHGYHAIGTEGFYFKLINSRQ